MFIPEKFKGRKALVIGAGKSGVACSNLLADAGFEVLLSDSKPLAQLKERLKGLNKRGELETGGHTPRTLLCDFAVKSPGLPHSVPLLVRLKERKMPVFSEIEVSLAFSKTPELLAVTGTNGKTTTTILLGEIMARALKRRGGTIRVCGNVGTPAGEIILKAGPRDAIVMEASSYQLEDSSFIRPKAACILNITPDHVDHHGTMSAYIKAKAKILRFQKKEDCCVFNSDDPYCRKLAAGCLSKTLFFSSSKQGGSLNAWVGKGSKAAKRKGVKIILKHNGKKISLTPPALPGSHNLENAMCAALMALERGALASDIRKAFASFKGVEHRIEPAGKARGMTFINDSKATNVDSTLVALQALGKGRKNIWLILGGLDKGLPYSPLAPYLKKYVKAVLAIGAAALKIEKELGDTCQVRRTGTMAAALDVALTEGEKGDMILLSPACASFDQFKDFEDRGKKFKELIHLIVKRYDSRKTSLE
jgi:UDP-N-acetylmuramoylalanine--D-glutamate ligase